MKTNILLVDDEPATQFGFTRYLTKAGYDIRCVSTLAEARDEISNKRYDAILLDMNLPDGNGIDWVSELRQTQPTLAVVVITGHGDIPVAVEAMRRGADQFLTKPVNMKDLEVYLRKGLELQTLRRGQIARHRLAKTREPYFGHSAPVKKMLDLATAASKNNSPVLLFGETGAGKGVLARWIYEQGVREQAPYVEVNCSSLRGELLASELFGHAKGAFTSAVDDKQGLIDVADGGVLFLDEIGDMDITVQAQFLKVIEEKHYRRVGEVKTRASDFRLICATNHDLETQSREGKFRRELYYRINMFPIEVPALREIREDIPGLVRYLLKTIASHDVEVSPEVMNLLVGYGWPGNVRELRNVLERALLLARGSPLALSHFPGIGLNAGYMPPDSLNLARQEEIRIRAAMQKFDGDTKKAAAALGISRATIYRRLKEMKIAEPVKD